MVSKVVSKADIDPSDLVDAPSIENLRQSDSFVTEFEWLLEEVTHKVPDCSLLPSEKSAGHELILRNADLHHSEETGRQVNVPFTFSVRCTRYCGLQQSLQLLSGLAVVQMLNKSKCVLEITYPSVGCGTVSREEAPLILIVLSVRFVAQHSRAISIEKSGCPRWHENAVHMAQIILLKGRHFS